MRRDWKLGCVQQHARAGQGNESTYRNVHQCAEERRAAYAAEHVQDACAQLGGRSALLGKQRVVCSDQEEREQDEG